MEFYGWTDKNPSKLELENRELARIAAEEGIVLLKNENSLPLKNKKIAVYGVGARFTANCGLGSGSLDIRHDVNIEEGLKNAGLEITSKKWLDDYDQQQKESYQQFHDMVESKVAGLMNPVDIIGTARSYVYRYPSGREITDTDINGSDTDTAIYVLTRQAGEGNDRKLEKGDFLITDIEKVHLNKLVKSYSNTILIINVGGIIDMSFLDEINEIKAVVQYGQAGEEGGNALANLLTGKINFSGKLADTIPLRYDDIPFGDEYGYLNGSLDNEYYKEGIYVGYRYYDSFHKDVRFPFGFGLSYTSFSIETTDVKLDKTIVKLTEKVTNVGKFNGKEVVQIYVSVPGQNKEFQRLIEFTKTREIRPNETEVIEMSFDIADCASYYEKDSCWKLESGSYLVRVGNSSRNTKVVAKLELPTSVVTVQCKNCCTLKDNFEELVSTAQIEQAEKVVAIKVDPKSFLTQKVEYKPPTFNENKEEKEFLDKLTVEEQIELLVGADLQKMTKGSFEIISAAGKTTTSLISKGLRNVIFSDGPAGLSILNELCYKADMTSVPVKVPPQYNWGFLGKELAERMCSSDGTLIYRYTTNWPVEIVLAQSWNKKILEEMGHGLSKEMNKYGVTIFLGPAMNIHRNPLCGRTFEYYSEDPILTGLLASSLINGIQNTDGNKTGVSLKHFCCNNTEDNRKHSSSNVSERALREIYLKGFEIAVRKSNPRTIMSSYNLLNHTYTANSRDLLTDILRCEWDFKGLVMTDWGSCDENCGNPALCPFAGNDLIMPGQDYCKNKIIDEYKKGNISKEEIRICASRVLHLVLNGVNETRLDNFNK